MAFPPRIPSLHIVLAPGGVLRGGHHEGHDTTSQKHGPQLVTSRPFHLDGRRVLSAANRSPRNQPFERSDTARVASLAIRKLAGNGAWADQGRAVPGKTGLARSE